jgi:EmrB/QacA subfamily drug resistance transporter
MSSTRVRSVPAPRSAGSAPSAPPAPTAGTDPGGFDRRGRLALAAVATGALMTVLDGSIVTVALPSIQNDLRFSPAGVSWVMNAYLLAFGGLLLLAGRLGDLIGRKRMFLAGTVLFVAASALAGAASTPAMLVAARFAQGIGSAAAAAVSLGILVTLFTEPRQRGKALGVYSFTGAAGASVGQVLGGVLTESLNWHWIFFINLPIGLATLALAQRAVPDDRGQGVKAGADVSGGVLVISGLMLGIYAVVGTAQYGWTSARTLGFGGLALLLLAGFLVRQSVARTPLMPLRLLRSRNVVGANLVQILMISAMFAFQIVVSLAMQHVLGYGAAATGLAMLPAAVSIGATALLVSAPLIARFGARRVLVGGLILLAAALLLLPRLSEHAGYAADLLPTMLLISGGGLAMPAAANLAVSGARERDAGLVSGLYNTTQQLGSAAGAAVLTTLSATRAHTLLREGRSPANALMGGYHLAFLVGAGLLGAAIATALLVLPPDRAAAPAPDPAAEPAAEVEIFEG